MTTRPLTIVRTDLGREIIKGMLADGVIISRPGDSDPDAIKLMRSRDLAALHIDGRRADVLSDVVVLPGSRLRGLQFMIDVRGLPPGRHLLETAVLPDPRDDDAGAKPASYRIPFWK